MEEKRERDTTRKKIYEVLKKEIFEGKFISMEVLVVDDLARRFGVSRTPVREALLTLASNGLLDAKHHVGFIVRPVDAKELIETYSLRILLERESARLAARNVGPAATERLRDLSAGGGNPDGRAFHAYVAEMSGWSVLAEMLEILMDKTARSRALFASASGLTTDRDHNEKFDHRAIYEAIAAREEDEAASLMELHLREAQRYILRALGTI